MADEWRRKTYYKPRVLLETARILSPQFDDQLLCITGAQLEMLRNLTQYLHRRSTFVSVYGKDHYLAPTNAEWDDLQVIVADLEEVLMGCDAITALLQQIMACVCETAEAVTAVPHLSPGLAPVVDGYLQDGGMQPADDYAGDTVLEAARCAVAQLVTAQAYEWMTEFIEPLQEQSVDILMPLAMVAIASMVGTPVLGIPTGILLALLWGLIEIWVDGAIQNVQNTLWSYQDELICAVWAGLATDYEYAELAATEVINGMAGLSPIDKVVLRTMYAPWAISLAAKAHANATAWALANVQAGRCDDCEWWYKLSYVFPPCPQNFTGSFPCASQGRPGINAANYAYSPNFTLPDILSNVDMDIDIAWRSRHGIGWTVGYITVQYQDVGLAWHNVTSGTCSNSYIAGSRNEQSFAPNNLSIPRNVLRVYLHGQPGQGTSDPWPFEPESIDITIYPTI